MNNAAQTPGVHGLGARQVVTLSRSEIDAIAAALAKSPRFKEMADAIVVEQTRTGVDAIVAQAGERVLQAAQGVATSVAQETAERTRDELESEARKAREVGEEAQRRLNTLSAKSAVEFAKERKESQRRFRLFSASFAGTLVLATSLFAFWTFAVNGRVQKSEEKLANAEERMTTIADGAARLAVNARVKDLTDRMDALARSDEEQRELLNTHTGEIADLQGEQTSFAKKLGIILDQLGSFGQRLFVEEGVTAAISSDFIPSGMDSIANSRLCREQEPARKTSDGADILLCRDGLNGSKYNLACRPSPAGWHNCQAYLPP